jgi:hypothetical protein
LNWRLRFAVVASLALIAALRGRLDIYFLEETVVVLLVIAGLVLVVLLLLVALVLFREGARSGILWLKTRIVGVTSTSGRHIATAASGADLRPLK